MEPPDDLVKVEIKIDPKKNIKNNHEEVEVKSSKAPKKDFGIKIKETVLECIKIRADEAGTEFSCSQCNFKTYESEKLNVHNVFL